MNDVTGMPLRYVAPIEDWFETKKKKKEKRREKKKKKKKKKKSQHLLTPRAHTTRALISTTNQTL
jgi:hypothetical protein